MVDQFLRSDPTTNSSTLAILRDGHFVHLPHVDTNTILHLTQRLREAMSSRDGKERLPLFIGISDFVGTSIPGLRLLEGGRVVYRILYILSGSNLDHHIKLRRRPSRHKPTRGIAEAVRPRSTYLSTDREQGSELHLAVNQSME